MKKLLSLLLAICLMCVPIQTIHAQEPVDIIYDIINKDDHKKNGLDLINSIIGKDSKVDKEKVKVIKNKRELDKEIKESKKKDNKKTEKRQLKGIDVSKWNGRIDWKKVKKAGIDFCIIRTGYSKTVDHKFKYNIEEAIENGLQIGVYHFSYATTNAKAKEEAEFCLELIKPYKKYITLGVWFDYEYDSVSYSRRYGVYPTKKSVTSLAETFCSTVEKNGYSTGIYTNLDFSSNYFTKEVLNKYPTWIAVWGKMNYHGKYVMWQYTDSGRVDGIHGKVDMNIFYYRGGE